MASAWLAVLPYDHTSDDSGKVSQNLDFLVDFTESPCSVVNS